MAALLMSSPLIVGGNAGCRRRWRVVTATNREDVGHGYAGKPADKVRVMVTGSTGYIGRFVVRELVNRGYQVLAVARERSGTGGKWDIEAAHKELSGAQLCVADVTQKDSLESALQQLQVENENPIDVVVCCLASRNGGVADSWKIDYQASRNSLDVGAAFGASHFVLLSAVCVQKPLLQFQKAKLKLESEVMQRSNLTWSIVRPTAFFKSLAGQVEIVKSGGPYVVFGDGKLCSCKPISEPDLARFISDCISRESLRNKVLPIGGPGKAYTPLEQGEMLFRITGRANKFIKVPIEIMDAAISFLSFLEKAFPWVEDAAEYARIGRYYAAESMLVLDPENGAYNEDATPSYGTDTLEDFFQRVVDQGMAGQELGEQAFFLQQSIK